MPLRDIAMLVLLCLIWAANVLVSRVVVTDLGVPPLWYAALRCVVVMVALAPWLKWPGRDWWRVAWVTTAVSGGGFALLFVGLRDATASSSAIVQLSGAPMTVLLAMVILKEQVRWRRGIGIALALGGVLLAVASPAGWENSTGLLFVFAGAFVGALGSVYLKTIELSAVRMMAWAGFFSSVLLLPLSFALESGQIAASLAVPWELAAALAFSGLLVSVFAHTVYFRILQDNEAGVVAPITLLTPVFTILMGATLAGEPVGLMMLTGAALAVSGVMVIAVRPSRNVFKGLLVRPRL